MSMHTSPPRALALFSGGLDSILAAKVMEEQGVAVTCLHFVSPFFGKPERVARWRRVYGLDIRTVDVGEEFASMLAKRPVYGFGSVLNPCVDCKILMMRRARALLEETGACCVVSGEVLGQRPMSQRRDTLNVIARDAGIKGLLLRPLSALRLDPTQAELAGLVDRERLLGIYGRGRKDQLALAGRMGITEIPTPAGGCRLAEQENARSYWPVLRHAPGARADDFSLANTGRQFWRFAAATAWLTVGRNQADNDALMELARPGDLLFKVRDFPGPVALGRFWGREWDNDAVRSAAALVASYSPRAVRCAEEYGSRTGEQAGGRSGSGEQPGEWSGERAVEGTEEGAGGRQVAVVAVRVHRDSLDGPGSEVGVVPSRAGTGFAEYPWEQAREEIRAEAREREAARAGARGNPHPEHP